MDFLISLLLAFFSFFNGSSEFVDQVNIPAIYITAEVVRVVDGDTIVVSFDGKEQTIRYIGIDSPEPYRDEVPACFSLEASLKNKELVEGKIVKLGFDVENADRYGRLLRYVYVDETFVNAELVAGGYAKIMTIKPNTAYRDQFSELEKQARERGVGLWGHCE